MKSRPFAFAVIALTMACHDTRQPTEPDLSPSDPSKIISDGAHGGNKDFFFLPPMVPLPLGNPDFELGKFNNTLRASIRIDICELKAENLNAQGLPTASTGCVAGNPVKTFPTGSVNLVNLPLRQNGWWTLFNLPPDGFYYVLWDTRQSNLNVSKYYRIKVFIDGATDPLGVADVDPMANIFQWKYTLTGQVIQLVDDVMLPIAFRIENGGGGPLCGGASVCVSKTVSANTTDPSGVQNVTVDAPAGSIAGASFPNGWLPAGGPQNVVVTITQVNTQGGGSTTDAAPCHPGLALMQFRGCFRFTTTPQLASINENGDQFAQRVRVAVCYELDGSLTNPLTKFAELWASGPNEPPHPLDDASDVGLLGAAARNCNTTPPVITQANSNAVLQFASTSWQHVKHGFSRLFGVKTAYAVDLGLGGWATAFSQVSPVLTADIVAYTSTNLTNMGPGVTTTATARIIGNDHHSAHTLATGLGGLPVTFTLAAGNGSLLPIGGEGAGGNQVTITTNTNPIDGSPVSGGGFAPVNWTLPTAPGTYTLSASGPALGGPVTFTATVTASLADLSVTPSGLSVNDAFALNKSIIPTGNGVLWVSAASDTNTGPGTAAAHTVGWYISSDANITTSDTFIRNFDIGQIGSGLSAPLLGLNLFQPQGAPGTYYVGELVDNGNAVTESNELNNSASVQFEIRQTTNFETYPTGGAVCNGAASCPMNDEYPGVVFSFSPDGGQTFANPYLCRTVHGPVGAPSNYGVTPPADATCTGWTNGAVTMTFSGNPKTVWFELDGNNGASNPFSATALDANGNAVPIVQVFSGLYQDQLGNTFRYESRRVESAAGIASITVNSAGVVLSIDNLLIVP